MSLINFFDEPILYLQPSWTRQAARRQAAAHNAYRALAQQQAQLLSAFSDVFDNFTSASDVQRAPKTQLREVANGYVLEAELPGVRKEDLDVTIGEGGKTIRIEGKAVRRSESAVTAPAEGEASATAPAEPAQPAATEKTAPESTSTEVAEKPAAEVVQPAQAEYTSTFSQSFTLPRPVDGSKVVARLEDGVLRLVVPFLEDTESVKVTV
ncbi:HSP20-like chaperone, partial [Calocera viscosa TUFC12733]